MTQEHDPVRDVENIEVSLLLEAIHGKYGYDFRQYSRAHIKRRLRHRLLCSKMENMAAMMHRLLVDQEFFDTLLLDLSINVTEMFRDPWFYEAVRKEVVPLLRTYPFSRIWHAGCSSGEEVYSMAILLKEADLWDRIQIYATDLNEVVLKKAKEGIYPIEAIRGWTRNYQKSGGRESFADYYTAHYESAIIDLTLRNKVVFADHNLVTDQTFGEMHLIVCRNVLIYFSRQLQNRAIDLFKNSLVPGGFLCLGSKESLRFTNHEGEFEVVSDEAKIYRKKMNRTGIPGRASARKGPDGQV